jgi:hypothetical protein
MSNKLTLSNIYQVIDNHIESETQFMFVTDKNLAELICEYVADNYNLYDEDMELSDKYKDYYVSLYYDEDGVSFYCETARGISGEYKFTDAMEDHVDYFVCNGMSEHDVNIKLQGENCTWSWIDLKEDNQEYIEDCEDEDLEDNELEEQCDCPECTKNMYLAESVRTMFENQLCPQHIFKMLQDIYDKAFDDGYEDARNEMKDWLED